LRLSFYCAGGWVAGLEAVIPGSSGRVGGGCGTPAGSPLIEAVGALGDCVEVSDGAVADGVAVVADSSVAASEAVSVRVSSPPEQAAKASAPLAISARVMGLIEGPPTVAGTPGAAAFTIRPDNNRRGGRRVPEGVIALEAS
jgi:hypothetical protein